MLDQIMEKMKWREFLDQIMEKMEKMKWREFVTPNDEADDLARGCHTR